MCQIPVICLRGPGMNEGQIYSGIYEAEAIQNKEEQRQKQLLLEQQKEQKEREEKDRQQREREAKAKEEEEQQQLAALAAQAVFQPAVRKASPQRGPHAVALDSAPAPPG